MTLLLCGAATSWAQVSHVRAELIVPDGGLSGGTPFTLSVRLTVEPGWHIYGQDPGDAGLPTQVAWTLPPGFRAGPIAWPQTEPFVTSGVSAEGYGGEVLLSAVVTPPPDLAAGTPVRVGAAVSWLACSQECVPGNARLSAMLPVVARGGATSLMPLLLALAFAFLGGLILNLMPCVLPVLSLKVMAFLREAHGGRAAPHGVAFGAGVVVSFWIIAALLVALRAGGRLVGLGFQFQSPAFVVVMAALIFVLGLNMLGVFDIGFAASSAAAGAPLGGGLVGSFGSGLLTTAVSTPCTAPFMGSAIGFAVAQPWAVSFAVFTALGLGLAAPVVVLSAWPRLLARVPKPGRWMETLKQLLAFLMMATVVWLVSVLAAETGTAGVVALLAALVFVGLGAWVFGRWGSLARSRGSRIVAAVISVVLVCGSIAVAAVEVKPVGRAAEQGTAASTESQRAPGANAADARGSLMWIAFSPQKLVELREAGTPVFIDFTAAWCLTCRVNEAVALRNPAVEQALRDSGVVALRADWTDRDDEIAEALAGYGRNGVPLYVLYGKAGAEARLLPEVLTPGIVLAAFSDVSKGGK